MPKISVIVPVYKVEAYLPRCIDSILAQTFTDFELILVDDGSPDNCGKICDEYTEKDGRIIVVHKENGGVSAARNYALDIAKGEYIAFCDSDDYWDADYLHELFGIIVSKEVDCVSSGYRTVFDDKRNSAESVPPIKGYYENLTKQQKENLIKKVLCEGFGWAIWTKLFKKDIIKTYNIRFCTTCGNFAEDLGFVVTYFLYANSLYITDNCYYNYYQRENSMMYDSKGLVKLNEVNEVSCSIKDHLIKVLGEEVVPIIHFLVMYNQYHEIVEKGKIRDLGEYSMDIFQKKHHKRLLKKLRTKTCFEKLKFFFGKQSAEKIILFSGYCLHLNWRRYCYESAIYYKFFHKKGENNFA